MAKGLKGSDWSRMQGSASISRTKQREKQKASFRPKLGYVREGDPTKGEHGPVQDLNKMAKEFAAAAQRSGNFPGYDPKKYGAQVRKVQREIDTGKRPDLVKAVIEDVRAEQARRATDQVRADLADKRAAMRDTALRSQGIKVTPDPLREIDDRELGDIVGRHEAEQEARAFMSDPDMQTPEQAAREVERNEERAARDRRAAEAAKAHRYPDEPGPDIARLAKENAAPVGRISATVGISGSGTSHSGQQPRVPAGQPTGGRWTK